MSNDISLIGASTTTIGFGLCGIKDTHELRRSASKEDILEKLDLCENNIVMIDQIFFDKIKGDLKKRDITFIKIPDRYNQKEEDIDALITDTVGVAIKDN